VNHVHSQRFPGKFRRVAFREYLDPVAIDQQVTVINDHFAREFSMRGVVTGQVGIGLGITEVIDGDDADLIRFCETGVPLCVDEAYLDYNTDRPSKASLFEKYPQVFLSVTFSKAYGFAGIRFGFVLGTEEMIAAFNRMFLPWNVSRMSAAAAEAILDNPDEVKAKVEHNNKWMNIFSEELKKLGLKPFPAHGNYMLIDGTMTGKTTDEILKAALDKKIFLKKIGEINGKTGYFRVTPGTDEENERFLKFIKAYFG